MLCSPVSLADVLSSDSKFWQFPSDKHAPGEVSLRIQQDIIEAFQLKRRCDEELLLLNSKMHNVINYWNQREHGDVASFPASEITLENAEAARERNSSTSHKSFIRRHCEPLLNWTSSLCQL